MVSTKNVAVRTRIRGHALYRHGIAAEPDDALALATEFAVSPGIATGATAGTRLADGDIGAVRDGVRSLARLFGHNRPAQAAPARLDAARGVRVQAGPRAANRLSALAAISHRFSSRGRQDAVIVGRTDRETLKA